MRNNNQNLDEQADEIRKQYAKRFENQQEQKWQKAFQNFNEELKPFQKKQDFHDLFCDSQKYLSKLNALNELYVEISKNDSFLSDDISKTLKKIKIHIQNLYENVYKNSTINFENDAEKLAELAFSIKLMSEHGPQIIKYSTETTIKKNEFTGSKIQEYGNLDVLPQDMKIRLFQELSPHDILQMHILNKSYNNLLSDKENDYIWKALFQQHFPRLHYCHNKWGIPDNKSWRESYKIIYNKLFGTIEIAIIRKKQISTFHEKNIDLNKSYNTIFKVLTDFISGKLSGQSKEIIQQQKGLDQKDVVNEIGSFLDIANFIGHQDLLDELYKIYLSKIPTPIMSQKFTVSNLGYSKFELDVYCNQKNELLSSNPLNVLFQACKIGNEALVEWILSTYLFSKVELHSMVYEKAIRSNPERRKYTLKILNEHGLNANSTDTRSPISEAITTGDIEIIQLLLLSGADLSHVNTQNIFLNAVFRNYNEIAWLLYRNNALFAQEIKNKSLIESIERKNCEMAFWLLEKGADANFEEGVAPLSYAIINRDVDMINALLKYGAIVQPEKSGGSPLILAFESNDNTIIELILKQNIKLYRDFPDVGRVYDQHSLWHAVSTGCLHFVTALLEKGANPNVLCRGKSPLCNAVQREQQNIVGELLESGADPNFFSYEHEDSPLFKAISNKNLTIMSMLLEAGADPNEKKIFLK